MPVQTRVNLVHWNDMSTINLLLAFANWFRTFLVTIGGYRERGRGTTVAFHLRIRDHTY
jgi:hypothetical protein